MAPNVSEVSSEAELHAVCGGHGGLTAVLLWAPWHPPSVHLTKVLEAIAAEQKDVHFAKVNTDVCPGLATSLGAEQVPFAAFLDPRGKKIDALSGADPPKLVEKVKALASRPFSAAEPGRGAAGAAAGAEKDASARLKELVNFSPVMLFMKGSKSEPFCKFSKQAVAILNKYDTDYSTFDILKDDEVRQSLKDYSNWKTYPQLYIGGELLGGVDILKEMDEDGSLADALPKEDEEQGEETLEDKLKRLINLGKVTLFMKGNPDTPRCGFSGKTVELLNQYSIEFSHFDILSDEDVRQGLKTYSNWPTFPQVYAGGKLVGGLDILKELAEEGALVEELGGGA